ncbi:MAG: hypothetical protein WCY70_06155 [Methanoculleus sp.]
MKILKIIVEKHPDGYVAYPLGLKGASSLQRGIPTKKHLAR